MKVKAFSGIYHDLSTDINAFFKYQDVDIISVTTTHGSNHVTAIVVYEESKNERNKV